MRMPDNPPTLSDLMPTAGDRLMAVLSAVTEPTVKGRYLHWDEIRRRGAPDGMTSQEWWLGLKLARMTGRRPIPLRSTSGENFSYAVTDHALAVLHRIDRQAAGSLGVPEPILSQATRDRYLVRSLMEEAIASSLLEGAATTRREAKELLRSGRRPRSRAERMVVNNYLTMQMIREATDEPLSIELILDIHRQVTEGALDDPDSAGRIQQEGEERVVVASETDDTVFYRPPPASELPDRLQHLVDFANAREPDPFVHPVIRAVAVHFWLAYDHPFVDGNGRTARALFYHSMLRQGYWLTEFVSISSLLYRAPAKYSRAFLYSETDESDLTYFLEHQLGVLARAIDELYEYLDRKTRDVRRVEGLLRQVAGLNHRQLDLLSHAVRQPDAFYTFASHQHSHQVVYQTSRTDLLALQEMGLLERQRVGQQYRFRPPADLETRLKSVRAATPDWHPGSTAETTQQIPESTTWSRG